MTRLLALLLLAITLLGCGAATPAPLRLRRVVLYRNGVGYFEQSGRHGREALTLHFRRREIDDVLQTLTVVDDAGPGTSLAAVLPQEAREGGQDDAVVGIDLQLGRAANRRLTVGYAVPTPTWVPAYRIVLPDSRGPGQRCSGVGARPQRHGNDWRDVDLTLAAESLSPMDMRTPRFVQRPDTLRLGTGRARRGPLGHAQVTDHDADGILDATDRCPDDTEAYSGYEDERLPRSRHGRDQREPAGILDPSTSTKAPPSCAPSRADRQALVATLRGNPHPPRRGRGHASEARRVGIPRRAVTCARLIAVSSPSASRSTPRRGNRRSPERAQARQRNAPRAASPRPAAPTRAADRRSALLNAQPIQPRQSRRWTARCQLASAVSIPSGTSTPSRSSSAASPRRTSCSSAGRTFPRRRAPVPGGASENGAGTDLVGGPVALFASGSFVGQGLMDAHDRETASSRTQSIAPPRPRGVERARRAAMVSVARRAHRARRGRTHLHDHGRPRPSDFLRHGPREGYAPTTLPSGAVPTSDAWLIPLELTPGRPTVLTIEERRPVRRTIALADGVAPQLSLYVENADLDPDTERRLQNVIELRSLLGRSQEAETELRGPDRTRRAHRRAPANLLATDRARRKRCPPPPADQPARTPRHRDGRPHSPARHDRATALDIHSPRRRDPRSRVRPTASAAP
jgi:hypothetical protein